MLKICKRCGHRQDPQDPDLIAWQDEYEEAFGWVNKEIVCMECYEEIETDQHFDAWVASRDPQGQLPIRVLLAEFAAEQAQPVFF